MTPAGITWTFLAPSLPRPAGGLIALFEVADAIAREGRDLVHLVHVPTADAHLRDLGDLPWFTFDGAVEHHFAVGLDPDDLPDADVVVFTTMLLAVALAPGTKAMGRRLVESLQDGQRLWRPLLFLQGSGVFPPAVEDLALRLPGPKVCVGSWLVERLLQRGVPASEVVHIPNGVDHHRFGITRPISDRPARVATNFDPHPVKGGEVGIVAFEALHRRLGVPATVFGTRHPARSLGPGVTFVLSPSQAMIAEGIYNETSVFLQPSQQEGFGMCAVEAMACGCALVTTANGGSSDYAIDGETALVCGGEAEEMVDVLARLVLDDELRIRIATNGTRFVERFHWSTSAERLRALVSPRLADPAAFPSSDPVDLDAVVRSLKD